MTLDGRDELGARAWTKAKKDLERAGMPAISLGPHLFVYAPDDLHQRTGTRRIFLAPIGGGEWKGWLDPHVEVSARAAGPLEALGAVIAQLDHMTSPLDPLTPPTEEPTP